MGEGLLSPLHLLIIFLIAVFIFGPKKIPELGKSLGEGIRGFKDALSSEKKPEQDKAAQDQQTIDSQSANHE
jgi:sec-independent protein translocase protein TatA